MGEEYPAISPFACQLQILRIHATSCVTERTWGLWGKLYMYCKTCLASSLSVARAENLVAASFAAKVAHERLKSCEMEILCYGVGEPQFGNALVDAVLL